MKLFEGLACGTNCSIPGGGGGTTKCKYSEPSSYHGCIVYRRWTRFSDVSLKVGTAVDAPDALANFEGVGSISLRGSIRRAVVTSLRRELVLRLCNQAKQWPNNRKRNGRLGAVVACRHKTVG
jgi:hypothetical protein